MQFSFYDWIHDSEIRNASSLYKKSTFFYYDQMMTFIVKYWDESKGSPFPLSPISLQC